MLLTAPKQYVPSIVGAALVQVSVMPSAVFTCVVHPKVVLYADAAVPDRHL